MQTLTAEPVQFSHKRHAALKLKCLSCHATEERVSCQACHTRDPKMTPEKPVNRLPGFVFFSHSKHTAAKIQCETCHGNVWRQDPVLAMKMKACVDCHKSSGATVSCTKCHELSQ